jgi:integrase
VEWTATDATHIRAQRRLIADDHVPISRRTVHRIVATTAARAGIGHVHPHQLRHTLATQAINRGMRLEAIAALLGHYAGDPVKSRGLRRPLGRTRTAMSSRPC